MVYSLPKLSASVAGMFNIRGEKRRHLLARRRRAVPDASRLPTSRVPRGNLVVPGNTGVSDFCPGVGREQSFAPLVVEFLRGMLGDDRIHALALLGHGLQLRVD